jgi:hypothetical protein
MGSDAFIKEAHSLQKIAVGNSGSAKDDCIAWR